MQTFQRRFYKHYLPLLLVIILNGFVFYFKGPKWDFITFITNVSGYIAIVLIALTLIIGPINIIFNRRNPNSTYFRRDLGIVAGVLTLIHSIFGLFVHLRGNLWKYFFDKNEQGYFIPFDDFRIANYTGLISALLIVVVLVTSNDYFMVKLTSRKWKNIQRFSYLVCVFAIVHIIYYRFVMNSLDLLKSFYLPMIAIVIGLQGLGVWKRLRHSTFK